MVSSRSVLACSICIFALVGCGDSPQADGPAVSVTDIERGWEATQAILDDATDMPGQPLMTGAVSSSRARISRHTPRPRILRGSSVARREQSRS